MRPRQPRACARLGRRACTPAVTKMPSPVASTPSAQYSLTLRVEIDHRPGMLGKVATNLERRAGAVADVLEGADLFVGLSGARVIDPSALAGMNPDPIVFAMANPTPEVSPEAAAKYARVVATGRSDYPNQINNVLCFPGIFRGALDVRAAQITEEMNMAAARAIADIVSTEELREDYIIPSVFNREVVGAVASAVADEARESGTAEAGSEMGFASTEEFGVLPGR